jgi:hypothetical protein
MVAMLIRMYSVHTASVPEPVPVQTHPCTVYACTAVIPPSLPRRPVPRTGAFKWKMRMENENGKCEMKMKMFSSDHRVYLFERGTAVVRSGTSTVVLVFHLTAHTATLVLFLFCSSVRSCSCSPSLRSLRSVSQSLDTCQWKTDN